MIDEILKSASPESIVPADVRRASDIKWGVFIDAYLVDAARVGNRYAAIVYLDASGAAEDGMTVTTPPVIVQRVQGSFTLLRSQNGSDHYVVVSKLEPLDRSVLK